MNLLKKVLKKLEGEISVIPSINVYDSVRYFKNKKYSNVFRENSKTYTNTTRLSVLIQFMKLTKKIKIVFIQMIL